MSRVVKVAGAAAGGGASAGLSTADVTKLIQDNVDAVESASKSKITKGDK